MFIARQTTSQHDIVGEGHSFYEALDDLESKLAMENIAAELDRTKKVVASQNIEEGKELIVSN